MRNDLVEAAVAEARVAVCGADSVTLDWAAPVLFVRADDGPPYPAADRRARTGNPSIHETIHS